MACVTFMALLKGLFSRLGVWNWEQKQIHVLDDDIGLVLFLHPSRWNRVTAHGDGNPL